MRPDPWMDGPPRRFLLATDLSARCDRALDRSVQLAGEWGAELVALTVMEPGPLAAPAAAWLADEGEAGGERLARRMLQRELARSDVPAVVELAQGKVTDAIRERAQVHGCPLVVLGLARDEPFGRLLAGSTAENLARPAAPMLLVVRHRPQAPYRKVLVATDFSEASRHALQAALKLFPQSAVVLYHAYEPAFSGLVQDAAQLAAVRDVERQQMPAFLAATPLLQQERARIRPVVEGGAPERVAARYLRDHDIPLAVIGTKGRSGVADLLLGSAASTLLQWLPSDVLLVRRPPG